MRISSGFCKMSCAVAIVFSSLVTTSVMAGNYGVQVGAFKELPAGLVNRLKAYDSVTTVQGKTATSIIVGSFSTKDDAMQMLNTLENAGYSDAFVRDIDKAQAQSSGQRYSYDNNVSTARSDYASNNPFSSAAEKAKFDSLSPQEQRNAVILDGKLHLKQGDQFLPINVSNM